MGMETNPQHISDYLETHTAMQGLDKAIAHEGGPDRWHTTTLEHLKLSAPGAPPALEFQVYPDSSMPAYHDALGHVRHFIIGRTPHTHDRFFVWMSKPDEDKVEPVGLSARRDPQTDKLFTEYRDQRIYNDRFMYDHQARATADYAKRREEHPTDGTSREVMVFATGTGKSYIIAHTLKAMGGDGVVIAPDGLGEQMRKDLAEVMHAPQEIRLGKDCAGDASTLARQLEAYRGILIVEERELGRFMGTEKKPGFLCSGRKKFIAIDEAHEFTASSNPNKPAPGIAILQRLAQHNDIMAVTATPNPQLYDALGIADRQPASSMTMYDAMHRLPDRPFRPLALELAQVGTPASIREDDAATREATHQRTEEAMRFEALVGYFGREEYIAPDFYRESNKGWEPRLDNAKRYSSARNEFTAVKELYTRLPTPPHDAHLRSTATLEALVQNRVRYSEHKNIAFAVRNDLVCNLAKDFQAIHDGRYEHMEKLTQEVWKRRAQSAIAAYLRTSQREFGNSETIEDMLHKHDLSILSIREENLNNSRDQQKYREAIRRIDPEDFRALMPALFEQVLGTPATLDLTRESVEAAQNTAQHALLRKTAENRLHISAKEARRLDLSGALLARLHSEGVDTDVLHAEPAYYALAVIGDQPGKEAVYDTKTGEQLPLNGDDVARMVREGKVMHVVNNYRFTTGFSDPDVMMTQRIIENIGDNIVRATQILGRPIREKDGIAAVQEIVGPYINLKGTPGIDKHFTCYDVVSKDYLKTVHQFSDHWRAEGQALWAPDTVIDGPAHAAQIGAETGKARA